MAVYVDNTELQLQLLPCFHSIFPMLQVLYYKAIVTVAILLLVLLIPILLYCTSTIIINCLEKMSFSVNYIHKYLLKNMLLLAQ